MTNQKALEISKKIEAMTDQMIELMKDKDFDGDHISLVANKTGFITISFGNVTTEKGGPGAPYVTRQTTILER